MVDYNEMAKKIIEYKRKGILYPAIECYVDMQEELEKKKIIEAEKCNGVVVDEPSPAREQRYYSSFIRLPKRSVPSSSSTCYKVPLGNFGHIPIKKRPLRNDNMVHQERMEQNKKITMKTNGKHHQHQKKKQKKSTPPAPPPDMPNKLRQAIDELQGTNPVWLTEKNLTESDTNPHLNRLLLTNCGEALEKFLTAEEMEEVVVLKGSMKDTKGLKVMAVDTRGKLSLDRTRSKLFDLDLKHWVSLRQYVLGRSWNEMVKTLGLEPELHTVHLWCFRLPAEKGTDICFAINVEET